MATGMFMLLQVSRNALTSSFQDLLIEIGGEKPAGVVREHGVDADDMTP